MPASSSRSRAAAIKHAARPFFTAPRSLEGPAFLEDTVEFDWHAGMSWQVRQRSSDSMAAAILERFGRPREDGLQLLPEQILEVSTASHSYELGRRLSALNLVYRDEGSGEAHPVENWFQAAKVFEKDGYEFGPYEELLYVSKPKRFFAGGGKRRGADFDPFEGASAEDDLMERIRRGTEGARMTAFEFLGRRYPLVPRSCFYDFLYVGALSQEQNRDLAEGLRGYRVFTDIMFNPGAGRKRKFNTQARSCAIAVSLMRRGQLELALEDIEGFIELVYGGPAEEGDPAGGEAVPVPEETAAGAAVQGSLFDADGF